MSAHDDRWAVRAAFALLIALTVARHFVIVAVDRRGLVDHDDYYARTAFDVRDRLVVAAPGFPDDRESDYPPLGSWFIGASMAVFGVNRQAFRLLGLLFALVFPLWAYLAGSRARGGVFGLACAVVVVTTPMLDELSRKYFYPVGAGAFALAAHAVFFLSSRVRGPARRRLVFDALGFGLAACACLTHPAGLLFALLPLAEWFDTTHDDGGGTRRVFGFLTLLAAVVLVLLIWPPWHWIEYWREHGAQTMEPAPAAVTGGLGRWSYWTAHALGRGVGLWLPLWGIGAAATVLRLRGSKPSGTGAGGTSRVTRFFYFGLCALAVVAGIGRSEPRDFAVLYAMAPVVLLDPLAEWAASRRSLRRLPSVAPVVILIALSVYGLRDWLGIFSRAPVERESAVAERCENLTDWRRIRLYQTGSESLARLGFGAGSTVRFCANGTAGPVDCEPASPQTLAALDRATRLFAVGIVDPQPPAVTIIPLDVRHERTWDPLADRDGLRAALLFARRGAGRIVGAAMGCVGQQDNDQVDSLVIAAR